MSDDTGLVYTAYDNAGTEVVIEYDYRDDRAGRPYLLTVLEGHGEALQVATAFLTIKQAAELSAAFHVHALVKGMERGETGNEPSLPGEQNKPNKSTTEQEKQSAHEGEVGPIRAP